MKISCLFAAALAAVNLLAAKPVATSVTARQRYPWNGKVDIVVTFSGASNDVAETACVFAATNSATKAALAMAHVTDAGTMSGSGATWTRRSVWDAAADLGEVTIADVVLAAEATTPLGGVQLWEGGPYWAECNVGATKPEEYGYYFWWGDTVGYARNDSDTGWVSSRTGASFSFSSGNCPTYGKTTAQLQSAGYIDATGNLVAKYDAATAHLGAPWRMPTDAEFAALINNCTSRQRASSFPLPATAATPTSTASACTATTGPPRRIRAVTTRGSSTSIRKISTGTTTATAATVARCVLSEDLPSSARTARASDSWGGMRPPIERCR